LSRLHDSRPAQGRGAQPIAPGGSVDVRFLLGVRTPGNFRFFLNVEALP